MRYATLGCAGTVLLLLLACKSSESQNQGAPSASASSSASLPDAQAGDPKQLEAQARIAAHGGTPLEVREAFPDDIKKIVAMSSMQEALTFAKRDIGPIDQDPDKPHDVTIGTGLFIAWARQRMRWSDVNVSTNETSWAMMAKDSKGERGKRLCFRGTIIQITQAKEDAAFGWMFDDDKNIFWFMALGSTGKIVDKSEPRICAVATEVYRLPQKSDRPDKRGVRVVGMFDIPQNKGK